LAINAQKDFYHYAHVAANVARVLCIAASRNANHWNGHYTRGWGEAQNLLCFFLNGSGFEKWEELVMDQKYETKLVLHLGISTSRARMQKK